MRVASRPLDFQGGALVERAHVRDPRELVQAREPVLPVDAGPETRDEPGAEQQGRHEGEQIQDED